MNDTIDAGGLRREIRGKYRDVALQPGRAFDFRTGRPLAEFLGYPRTVIDALPGRAVESFAGVGTRSPCGRCGPGRRSWMSAAAPGSTRSSPPARSAPAAT
jgi:arsenite methyltransferase